MFLFKLFEHITFIYILYLLYGAAFLFLGVAIAAKDMKGSDLQLADSLWLLKMFGFLHGAHEWLELGPLIKGKNLSFQQIYAAKAVGALLVIVSFVFLLQFGIALVRVLNDKRGRWTRALPAPLFLIWALYVWHFGLRGEGFHIDMDFLFHADIGARQWTWPKSIKAISAANAITGKRPLTSKIKSTVLVVTADRYPPPIESAYSVLISIQMHRRTVCF